MSADAKLLGARGSELRGFPLLGLVHPSAATAFLGAAIRASTEDLAITVLLRMRACGHAGRRWADRYCLIVSMCQRRPPRLGIVVSAAPDAESLAADQLDWQVRHAGVEKRGADTPRRDSGLRRLPSGHELSARQSEIVARLAAGETASEIAARCS